MKNIEDYIKDYSEDEIINIDNINTKSTKYIKLNDTLYSILFASAIYCFYINIITSSI